METIFLSVFNRGLAAGWLIVAVLLLRLLFQKAPKWVRSALWGLVAFRLICPFSLPSVLSLIPSAQPLPPDGLYTPAPYIQSGFPKLNETVNPILSEAFAVHPENSVNPAQIVAFCASIVWLAGLIGLLLYIISSTIRLWMRLREAVVLHDNVRICDRIDTPFVFGLFRPRIYLPSTLTDGQEYVLAHEAAHVRRHDPLRKMLAFLLLCVYWFQPLCWVAYALFCRDMELACDERVTRGFDAPGKKAYTEALLSCSMHEKRLSVSPVAFGEVGVKGRIKAVFKTKKPLLWLIPLAVLAIAATALCLLTDPINVPAAGPFEDPFADKSVSHVGGADGPTDITIDKNTPYFGATVLYATPNSMLVRPFDTRIGDQIFVSLAGLHRETVSELSFGARIGIFYDGLIQETYPAQIPNVYAIENLVGTSADPVHSMDYRIYRYADRSASGEIAPVIELHPDQTFQFLYPSMSGAVPHGQYEWSDHTLILHGEDGTGRYVFTQTEGAIRLDAGRSSPIPFYLRYEAGNTPAPTLPDGATFYASGVT